jgi:hypothetical protein
LSGTELISTLVRSPPSSRITPSVSVTFAVPRIFLMKSSRARRVSSGATTEV